nr:uncharacterized protein LOC116771476 [Danaus plexippus plexippus]
MSLHQRLCNDASVKQRWRCYFKELLNTQHPCSLPTEIPPNLGLIAPITPDVTRNCLRHMKNRQAVGRDDIPLEAWKSLGSLGVVILTDLINRVLNTRTMPDQWRYSYITPIYKGRGSVQDCEAILWGLRFKGIPEAYIDIIRDMYRDSVSMVRTAVGDTKPFPISVGVHQGSALSPFLFNVVLDTVSANIQDQPPWLMMYADDIALIDVSRLTLERRVNLSVKSEKFRYLGSLLHESGGIDHDVQARMSAACAKWREVTGVVCNRRIPPKLERLIYKSIIRPVLLYGSECWPTLSWHTQELHVTEMKMLR